MLIFKLIELIAGVRSAAAVVVNAFKLVRGVIFGGAATRKVILSTTTWAERLTAVGIVAFVSEPIIDVATSIISKGASLGSLVVMKVFPEHAAVAIAWLATQITNYSVLANHLAAETMSQIMGVKIDIPTKFTPGAGGSRREELAAIGDQFGKVVTTMFDVSKAAEDFKTRTGFAGSFGNLHTYFGTNIDFQMRSLAIGTVASMSGIPSLRHLEQLHQSVNWAFGFGWLSWTVMSSYMEVAVLPGLKRKLMAQVLPNDYTEGEVYNMRLTGLESDAVFQAVCNNLGLRQDTRAKLLFLKEAQLTDADVRDLYQRDEWQEDDVLGHVRLKGYMAPRAAIKQKLIQEDRLWSIRDKQLQSLGRQFRDCVISESDLRSQLGTYGWQPDEIGTEVLYWLTERRQRRFLTLGQMNTAVELGVMTAAERSADLACQGYTARDISFLLTVTADEPIKGPIIRAFTVSPSSIEAGDQIEINWRVEWRGPRGSVSILPGLGIVGAIGSRIISVNANTTFNIRASSTAGNVERFDSVIVQPATPTALPTVSFSITPARFEKDTVPTSVLLTWSTTRATSVRIDPILPTAGTQGTHVIQLNATTTFTLVATGPGGVTRRTRTVVATEPEVADPLDPDRPFPVSFAVSRSVIEPDEDFEIRWNAEDADSVTIQPLLGPVPNVGSRIVRLAQTTTLLFTATRDTKTVTRERSVIVRAPDIIIPEIDIPEPRISLNLRPATVNAGQDFEISWGSSHASEVKIEPLLGTVAKFGSRIIQVTANTTFTAEARGLLSTARVARSVIVRAAARAGELAAPPLPTVSLTLRPGTITLGDPVEVEWTVSNANTVAISPGIGPVGTQGSRVIFPQQTTTFRLTAIGPGGTTQDDNSLIVVAPEPEPEPPALPLPSLSFSVRPATTDIGDPVEIRWSSRNAEIVTISPDLGIQAPVGSVVRTLGTTTTFTATAEGPGGMTERAASVIVRDPEPDEAPPAEPVPTASISVSPSRITRAAPVELKWSTRNAVNVSIEPDLGFVAAAGVRVLEVTETTIFRIIATGPGGTTVREDVVIVLLSEDG